MTSLRKLMIKSKAKRMLLKLTKKELRNILNNKKMFVIIENSIL